MWNNQQNWDKMTVLILCAIDLDTRKQILKESGITLPEILERVSDCGKIWKQKQGEYNLKPLRLSIEEWLEDADTEIKAKVIEAFSVMKINYVFQIYGYTLRPNYLFFEMFKKNFSSKDMVDAVVFIEERRVQSKLPKIDSTIFDTDEFFWIRKTWGM